jgi:acetyl-CoA carboxylase carboxyl transferase subunit beta
MNWLTNIIPPRIRSFVSDQREIPDNMWQKCPSCDGMLFHRDLADNLNVCYHCNHHLRIKVPDRLALMFDDGKYEKFDLPKVEHDPLKFKDRKKYADRIKEAQAKTGLKDAITVAKGTVGGQDVVVAAFNFSYMGGSMGVAVGEALVMAAQEAVKANAAFIAIPASGGARMQEGMLSLMQMPRSIIAVEMVKEKRLPYIVILTDPTTGGVSASFAMVGDIHIAEPGAMIGFAGRRVIEETVREQLPENFQTAEYLLEHGIVDMVVSRKDMKEKLANLISILMKRPSKKGSPPGEKKNGKSGTKGGNGNGKSKKSKAASPVATPGNAQKTAASEDHAHEKQMAKKAQAQVQAAKKSVSQMKASARKAATKAPENKKTAQS